MELSLLMEYGGVILILIALEGILSADNALVLAIIVKHLPEDERKKALFYGLFGALVFRFGSLFLISFLVNVWQMQAIGAVYLLFLSINHLVRTYMKENVQNEKEEETEHTPKKKSGFWLTVLKVEVTDTAFAMDSILAAVAFTLTITPLNRGMIGGLDAGRFVVVLTGGMIGLIIMRFAATYFLKLLRDRPGLETAAFMIVGWVGVKLIVSTLAHPSVGIIDKHFPQSITWKVIFYVVLLAIGAYGWFLSPTPSEK
ncbi:TerC family protein [Bacillus sp. DX4.1]|uniref:TerC family protein n=1 Tax=Bacillus sp. DX4.1 TaxID=3055867 RepID=UPI0025A18B88|nr:TerC family protein [Bacillus sp. DX4.1]MDM5188020.1 TerC family protein [Bacillus sp. DX4.1]